MRIPSITQQCTQQQPTRDQGACSASTGPAWQGPSLGISLGGGPLLTAAQLLLVPQPPALRAAFAIQDARRGRALLDIDRSRVADGAAAAKVEAWARTIVACSGRKSGGRGVGPPRAHSDAFGMIMPLPRAHRGLANRRARQDSTECCDGHCAGHVPVPAPQGATQSTGIVRPP